MSLFCWAVAVALVVATAYVLIGGLVARLREPWPAPRAERAIPPPFAIAAPRGRHAR